MKRKYMVGTGTKKTCHFPQEFQDFADSFQYVVTVPEDAVHIEEECVHGVNILADLASFAEFMHHSQSFWRFGSRQSARVSINHFMITKVLL